MGKSFEQWQDEQDARDNEFAASIPDEQVIGSGAWIPHVDEHGVAIGGDTPVGDPTPLPGDEQVVNIELTELIPLDELAANIKALRNEGKRVRGVYTTASLPTVLSINAEFEQETGRTIDPTTAEASSRAMDQLFRDALALNLFDSAELWEMSADGDTKVIMNMEGPIITQHDPQAFNSFRNRSQSDE